MKNELDASIIVLNYYGEKIIKKVIQSLAQLNYPKNKYEIIVVDNASKDNSKNILRELQRKYKNLKTILLNKNLGFAKANNIGIKNAKGKFITLLNNDCIVDKNWLKELISTMKRNKKIFAVGSKIYLYPKYFHLEMDKNFLFKLKNIYLKNSNLLNLLNIDKLSINFFQKNNRLILEVPFDSFYDKKLELELIILEQNEDYIKGYINDKEMTFKKAKNHHFKTEIKITKEIQKKSFLKIQNAGILVFQDGYGRDIGSIVKNGKQSYEIEKKQYDKTKEIYAACGAAVLYRKSILDKIGYLDENFFVYYEDVEISERARIYGYKIIYNPKAYVYHLHSLSSGEWSNFFIYNVEKGRLLHIFFNFPFKIFFLEFLKFSSKALAYLLKSVKNPRNLTKNFQYIKVVFYFCFSFPKLIIKRKDKYKNLVDKKALDKNYKKILEGYWLFH